MTVQQMATPGMIQVVNKRNNKTGEAERLSDGRWTIIFDEDGSQVDVSESTFKRWYKITGDCRPEDVKSEEPIELGDQTPPVEDQPQSEQIPSEPSYMAEVFVDEKYRTEVYTGLGIDTNNWVYTRVTKNGFYIKSQFIFNGEDMSKQLSSKYEIVKFIEEQNGIKIGSLRIPRNKK